MHTICLSNIFYSGKNHEDAKAVISPLRLQSHRTALKGVHIKFGEVRIIVSKVILINREIMEAALAHRHSGGVSTLKN